MLTGICLNCGADYYGWALSEERHQTCPECGSLLRVIEYGEFETQNSMSRGRTVIEERPLAREQKKSASKVFGEGGDLHYDWTRRLHE